MPYQICFTQTAGCTIPSDRFFLRYFINSLREELSTNATVETKLRKPVQYDGETFWIFCFSIYGVMYRIENDTQIKIIRFLVSPKYQNFEEADLDAIIQELRIQPDAADEIFGNRNEPISKSLEQIEELWLPTKES